MAPECRRVTGGEADDLAPIVDAFCERFTCSGTHTGPWLGYPATNRRFTRIPEVSIYTIQHGKIAHVWGLEDTYHRLKQLGLNQPS